MHFGLVHKCPNLLCSKPISMQRLIVPVRCWLGFLLCIKFFPGHIHLQCKYSQIKLLMFIRLILAWLSNAFIISSIHSLTIQHSCKASLPICSLIAHNTIMTQCKDKCNFMVLFKLYFVFIWMYVHVILFSFYFW